MLLVARISKLYNEDLVIKFVSYFHHVSGFSLGTLVFSTKRNHCHDIIDKTKLYIVKSGVKHAQN